jgi:hypothetical protein
MAKTPNETFGQAETVARREAALKRMLSTPPKPHEEMKIGKRKRAAKRKEKKPGR